MMKGCRALAPNVERWERTVLIFEQGVPGLAALIFGRS